MTETKPAGALAGVKVIDLSRVLGGPYCGQILGDHGAEVVKVEPPQGDETRDWGPPFKDGQSAYFSGVNRNKRSLALDISREEGREVLLKLLEGADVLLENFKTGTLTKWSLGYDEVLSKRFPRLVHCRVTGFGADGPFGGLPGYDAAIQAWTGWISINGKPDSGGTRMGIPMVDLGTGLNAVIGIMMALYERSLSGKGQFVEASLYDSAVGLLHPQAPNYLMSGNPPKLTGNAHPNISPYDLYPTKGRDIFLAVGNDRQFQRLCTELGKPDLADDERFRDNAGRVVNRPELTAELEALLTDHDGETLATRLMQIGVPAGAALTVPEVMEHPHTLHREMKVEIDNYAGTGVAVKMSRTPGKAKSKPPLFGADGRQVLADAGYSEAEIEALVADGLVQESRRKL